jgi:hypothetical protein
LSPTYADKNIKNQAARKHIGDQRANTSQYLTQNNKPASSFGRNSITSDVIAV